MVVVEVATLPLLPLRVELDREGDPRPRELRKLEPVDERRESTDDRRE